MAKKMGLGRGLSAILPDVEEVVESVESVPAAPAAAGDSVVQLPIGDIDPNRNQPRKKFDDDALLALAESIRHSGVISPILVARDGARYTIIAGERRWRAARLANLDTIPAIVREWDDVKRQEAALIENIQREDLNAIEEAQGIHTLMTECALTQEAVAERLGRSRSAVANLLRLLTLDCAAALAYLKLIEYSVRGSWFLPVAMPITVGVSILFLLCALVLRNHRRISGGVRAACVQLALGLATVWINMVVSHAVSGSWAPSWSIYAFLPLAALAAVSILLSRHKRFQEELHRRLLY